MHACMRSYTFMCVGGGGVYSPLWVCTLTLWHVRWTYSLSYIICCDVKHRIVNRMRLHYEYNFVLLTNCFLNLNWLHQYYEYKCWSWWVIEPIDMLNLIGNWNVQFLAYIKLHYWSCMHHIAIQYIFLFPSYWLGVCNILLSPVRYTTLVSHLLCNFSLCPTSELNSRTL